MENKILNLCMAFESTVVNYPKKGIAFISGERDEVFIEYQKLYQNALKSLYVLQSYQVKPGDELILQFEDNQEFLYYFWACLLGGIIPVPVAVGTTEEHKLKIIKIWKILNNPHLMTEEKVFNLFEKHVANKDNTCIWAEIKKSTIFLEANKEIIGIGKPHNPQLNDIAFIQFSSGSTGDPKGVILTHQNLLTNIEAIINRVKLAPEEKMLGWMPLTHDMGLISFHLTPVINGMNHYIMPTSLFIRHPVLWFKKVNEYRANILFSPNFGYKYFLMFFKPKLATVWDLSPVRIIFNGGEPISAELCNDFLDKLKEYGLKRNVMYPGYGLAEAGVVVSLPPLEEEFFTINVDRSSLGIGEKIIEKSSLSNSVSFVDLGYPVDNCSICVCDDQNNTLKEGVIGYVHIKGKNVSQGYYNNLKATEKVNTKDGWLNTGDLGFIRNGRLVITGRAKDVIFINGLNYYPQDIERQACDVDGIELGKIVACGCFNKERQTEEIIIFLLFKNELREFIPFMLNLKKHINTKMGLEVKEVIPIKKIPKTTSGKVQRYKLAEQYNRGVYEELIKSIKDLIAIEVQTKELELPRNEIEQRLQNIFCQILNIEGIGIHDNFFDYGGNSITLTQIHQQVEDFYPNKILLTDLFAFPTISRLAKLIQSTCIPIAHTILPQEYFNVSSGYNEPVLFEIKLDNNFFHQINAVTGYENIQFSQLLLVFYMYLLSKINGYQLMNMQVMIGQTNRVTIITLDFATETDLFRQIANVQNQCQDSAQQYSILEFNKISLKKASNCIAPFFYRKNLLNGNMNLLDIFDLVLEIDPSFDGIGITLRFNTQLLKKEKVKELLSFYVDLLQGFFDKFPPAIPARTNLI